MTIAFPHQPGIGGPGSFQQRFERALQSLDWQIAYANDSVRPDIVMVIGGTKNLRWLYQMKRAGVPILYRLDGIAWLHRKQKVSWKKFLLTESRNYLSKIIHAYFADYIVYQSEFVEEWWQRAGWRQPVAFSIITNGVDLEHFQPVYEKTEAIKLLCLEGTIDYSPYAIELINKLAECLDGKLPLVVYGGFQEEHNRSRLSSKINYRGKVKREDLPEVYRNAIYLSLDVNAACPNTVIEALASGVPVVGFATGALEELVPQTAGKIVPYGSDPWLLGFPDVDALLEGIHTVQDNWEEFSVGARTAALSSHDIQNVVSQYVEILNRLLEKQ
jgi:glycosyltransferase involved in cell wall biosynthesis